MGNKGGGKRISKKVIQYLQAYFHAGNLNPKDRFTAEKMHERLKELVKEKELSVEEIPEVKKLYNICKLIFTRVILIQKTDILLKKCMKV